MPPFSDISDMGYKRGVMKRWELLILLLLISYPPICALLFTPSLPEVAQYFEVSDGEAQMAMSLFLIGYTFGMLPYGPIANRFGRKKALWAGLSLALFGTGVALFSFSFFVFCLGRFLQALGAAAGLKVTFTMIGDLYQGHAVTKALATLTVAFGLMPGLGVAAGGFLTVLWGWKGCFAFLALYSLFLIAMSSLLPETSKILDRTALHIKTIAHNYWSQLKNPSLLLNAIMMGLASAIIYIFGTVAPIVSMQIMGASPDAFGLWNIVPSLGLVAGTVLARALSGKRKTSLVLLYGILLMMAGSAAMGCFFLQNWVFPAAFFFSMFFVQAGDNLFWVNASARGLSLASDKSNASAVMQFINIGMASLGTFISMSFSPQQPMVLPAAFGLIAILMLIVWGIACYTAPAYPE